MSGKILLVACFIPFLCIGNKLNISLSKSSLNLNSRDSIVYKFYLPSPAVTTIRFVNIYGGEAIPYENKKNRSKGWHEIKLHSDSLRRIQGNISSGVFYIEITGKAGGGYFNFDSFQSPWGNTISADSVQYDPSTGNITFNLKESSIVKTRIGYPNGALVRTLYYGLPKTPGIHFIHWDGMDQSGKINVQQLNEISAQVIAYSIPGTAFILENKQAPVKVNASPVFPDQYTKYALSSYAKVPFKDDFDIVVDYNVKMLENNMLNLSFGNQNQSFIKSFSAENEIYIYVEGAAPVENPNVAVPGDYTIAFSQLHSGKHLVLVNIILPNNRIAVGIKEMSIDKRED